MNSLNKNIIDYLINLFNVCNLCDIDSVSIEKSMVRGHSKDAKRGIYIMEYDNVPDMDDFDGIGIGSVKLLKNRMNILDDNNIKINYEIKTKDNNDNIIKKLIMSDKKTKIEYTCLDPVYIKSPRKMNDPEVYSFILTEDTVKIMNKIKNALEGITNNISFNSEKDGSIKFIISDEKGDIFDHTIATSYEVLDTEHAKPHFYNSYQIKYVYPLFKAAMDLQGESKVIMSSRGVIKIVVKGITIRIVAED